MNWANAVPFPFLMDQPVARRIGEILAERFERSSDDEFGRTENHGAFAPVQFSCPLRRQNFCPPENFVGHPIPDSGETALNEQDGFDRRFSMSIQKLADNFPVELAGNDFGSAALPPIGFVRPTMKPDPAKLPGIGENKRAFALKQDEMIVFGGSIIRGLDPDLSGHPEMNSKPHSAGEFKEHPFAPRVRTEKFFAD